MMQDACIDRWHDFFKRHGYGSGEIFKISEPRQWGKTTTLDKLSRQFISDNYVVATCNFNMASNRKKEGRFFRNAAYIGSVLEVSVELHRIPYQSHHLLVDDAELAPARDLDHLLMFPWKTITITESTNG